RYNLSTNEWTWMKGSPGLNQSANVGVQGNPTSLNNPGAILSGVSWVDQAGNFWRFGGYGHTSTGNHGYLNDLWKYSPTSNMWTWMKGNNSQHPGGQYGMMGLSNSANTPGGRMHLAS